MRAADLRVTRDPAAASTAAAREVVRALGDAIATRGVAHWATTGGSTPVGIYKALLEPELANAVDWSRVHVWWTDDRYVPSEHPLSNVLAFDEIALGFAGRSGLSGTGEQGIDFRGRMPGLPIPAEQVHRIPMAEAIGRSGGPEWAAAQYEETLRDADIQLDDAGRPVFDLLLLGVGGDGHILSVFPGSAVWHETAWVQGVPAPTHIEPHVPRVTLHPGVVSAARVVIVVVHGEAKAEILGRIFEGDDEREMPARIAARPGALWIVDEAAAARIGPPQE